MVPVRCHDEGAVLVTTPGYCMNVRTCRIAASGAAVRVALDEPFLCPECGGSLAPPALDTIRPTGRIALLTAVFACVAIGAGATVLMRSGLFNRPVAEPAPTLVWLAPALLNGPTITFAQDTLAAPDPLSVDAEEEAPLGRTSRKALPKAPRRTASRETAAPASHHANVHLSVSIPLVAGGQPDYPEQYLDEGRSGSVTIICGLQPDGSPAQCRTTQLTGGRIFDVSVHSWLDLKDVRFKPAQTRRRRPVHDVKLTVEFVGDGPPQE